MDEKVLNTVVYMQNNIDTRLDKLNPVNCISTLDD